MNEEEIIQALESLRNALANVDSARQQVENVTNSFGTITHSLSQFEQGVRSDTQRMSAAAETIGGATQTLNTISTTISALNTSLDGINQVMNAVQDRIVELQNCQIQTDGRIADARRNIADNIVSSRDAVNRHTTNEANTLTSGIGNAKTDIMNRLKNDQKETATLIHELSAKQDIHSKTLDSIKKITIVGGLIIIILLVVGLFVK